MNPSYKSNVQTGAFCDPKPCRKNPLMTPVTTCMSLSYSDGPENPAIAGGMLEVDTLRALDPRRMAGRPNSVLDRADDTVSVRDSRDARWVRCGIFSLAATISAVTMDDRTGLRGDMGAAGG